jgi:nucleotide-binding universal stress UspA family protein
VFTNILVALDGSKVSRRALIEAVDLARLMNAKIHAIHVMEAAASAQNSLDQMNTSVELYRLLEKEGKGVLEEANRYCADQGIAIIPHLKQGNAGTGIIALSEQEKCDLIVVASQGKSGFDRLFLGSVSSYVVKNNKGTTLVVRGQEKTES